MTGATAPGAQARDSPLADALAQALPKDTRFTAWHLSTTPATTEALCYPPALNSTADKRPSKPLRTYCEKHFLAVSVADPAKAKDVLVLGLEVYIYTTIFSTTIFIAKADSTGYLYLQSTPERFSPIRAITLAFLNFLIEHRRRPSKQLIVNLFARAQSQYIFPGSVENSRKHILDDRGLIKWWCRVLNPLLEHDPPGNSTSGRDRIHGYLSIPGLDTYETRAFIPKSENARRNWSLGHPLDLISPYTKDPANFGDVPPRCLIPTYPDDPKARFVAELEESTPERAKLLGGWKTPRTLAQFWDMMAFRQECSSGRMTGFVWVVFEPPSASASSRKQSLNDARSRSSAAVIPTPTSSFSGIPNQEDALTARNAAKKMTSVEAPTSTPAKLIFASTNSSQKRRRGKKTLTGPIISREPRVKTHRVRYPDQIKTPYYYWPEAGRGQVILDENGYKRAVELLLHLEFKTLDQAIASTARWVSEVNMGDGWAIPVTGEKLIADQFPSAVPSRTANSLTGSVVRKRKSEEEASRGNQPAAVNVLGGGLLRKKVKVDTNE
ncbi:hypothetical protein F4802DRAFT_317158 [Xylaria palmicola]|nr:hypothetical protein F4802DRAFT_317158 [Xylaria palmicola]